MNVLHLSQVTDYGVIAIMVGLVGDAIRRYVFERRRHKAASAQAESDAKVAEQTTELRVDAAALAHAEAQLDFTTKAFDAERASWQVQIERQNLQIASLRAEVEEKDRELAGLREQVTRMQAELTAMSATIDRLRGDAR